MLDLHVWRLGPGHMSAVVSVATNESQRNPSFYHAALKRFKGLSHVTVEVNPAHAAPRMVDVCRIDGKSGLCVGCFRTRDEIRGRKNMTDHRRHQVINDRSRREAQLQRASPDSSAQAENSAGGTP